ncbi:MAG: family 10 glycosylhydrolase [Candidatus Cyclobacteriaceae bacterium M3_2C_046]
MKYFICFSILVLGFSGNSFSQTLKGPIRGVYGHPKPIWQKGFQLNDLGVNAIFVHSGSIDQDLMDQAGKEGLQIFAEFATLNGKNYVDRHPEAWAVNQYGRQVEPAGWFMGVCPIEPGFRQFRQKQLRDLLTKFDLDGIWLDYVHWHAQFEEPEPILPETCFNDPCLEAFSIYAQLEIPAGSTTDKAQWILQHHEQSWRDWRCQVIYDWAAEMKKILKQLKPDALLGLYHCPWTDQEFEGARRRILGLDYDLLRKIVDVFSPMVYHGRMGRGPGWVAENIQWHSQRLSVDPPQFPLLWPIVQAYNDPRAINAAEFRQVLSGGLAGKASGVMMFTTRAVADDPDKIEVLKEVYLNLADSE